MWNGKSSFCYILTHATSNEYNDLNNADNNSDTNLYKDLKDADNLESNTLEDNRSNLVKKMFYNKDPT